MPSKFVGGWNQLVAGVNDTITNIVNPLNVTADYVEKVSKGVIPPTIVTEYKGQYNIIKNNLNNMVAMMNDLLAETDKIVKAAADGQLDTAGQCRQVRGRLEPARRRRQRHDHQHRQSADGDRRLRRQGLEGRHSADDQ